MEILITWKSLSKTDLFGTETGCLSYRGVRVVDSQTQGLKKGGTNSRCLSYEGVITVRES